MLSSVKKRMFCVCLQCERL